MQVRPKVTGLTEEAKVEAFEASKSSKSGKKGAKAQEEEHNSRQISCRGKIWTVELHVQAHRSAHGETDLSRRIWRVDQQSLDPEEGARDKF
jgi:hypothetical protein